MTSPPEPPSAIAGYDDWPDFARRTPTLRDADDRVNRLANLLGVRRPNALPTVREERTKRVGEVLISTLAWSVGYGPETVGYWVRPAGAATPLPGIVAMHAHGGGRFVGAEQLIDLTEDATASALRIRASWYDGLASANALAERGYSVLAHDTFSWGSRRFDLDMPTARYATTIEAYEALWRGRGRIPSEPERIDLLSGLHEDSIAKAAGVLGQTFAGAVVTDDLVALDVLCSLDGVDAGRIGSFGFSGGGARAHYLAALDARVRSTVVTCMMSTFAALVPRYLDTHTWLLHSPGLSDFADWPDLARIGSPRAFLAQYGWRDPTFPAAGMRDAHHALLAMHAHDDAGLYRGTFHDTGHVFDHAMQAEAWAFFDATL